MACGGFGREQQPACVLVRRFVRHSGVGVRGGVLGRRGEPGWHAFAWMDCRFVWCILCFFFRSSTACCCPACLMRQRRFVWRREGKNKRRFIPHTTPHHTKRRERERAFGQKKEQAAPFTAADTKDRSASDRTTRKLVCSENGDVPSKPSPHLFRFGFGLRWSKSVVQKQMERGVLPKVSAEKAQQNFRVAIESGRPSFPPPLWGVESLPTHCASNDCHDTAVSVCAWDTACNRKHACLSINVSKQRLLMLGSRLVCVSLLARDRSGLPCFFYQWHRHRSAMEEPTKQPFRRRIYHIQHRTAVQAHDRLTEQWQ